MGERSGAPSGFSPASIVISKPPVAVQLPQPDVSANRDAPQVKDAQVTNVRAPIVLDASQSAWPIASADGIICINMVHISPWDATVGLIRGAAAILPPGS